MTKRQASTRSNSRMGLDIVIHITSRAMVRFIMLTSYSIAVLNRYLNTMQADPSSAYESLFTVFRS
jgi:hypothetical protein